MMLNFKTSHHAGNATALSSRMARGIIKQRAAIFACMALFTLLLIFPVSQLKIDASGVSFPANDSASYKTYLNFVNAFGTDDYILLVVKNELGLADPELTKRLNKVHSELTAMNSIIEAISLESIKSSGLFNLLGASDLRSETHVSRLRQTIPGLDRLISSDMLHLGFIVKIDNETLNGFNLENQLNRMKQIITKNFPEHPYCYAVGIPVLRSAFERYNLKNAIIFGTLGLVFGTLIALYLFKTLWAVILVLLISLTSLIWTLGLMGVFKVDLNLATGLSFGFILVIATTTVFHILTTYFQFLGSNTSEAAAIKSFEKIIYPCFMCALTTSLGFFSLAISPVPMIRQAGFIISAGVMLTFLVSISISAFFLPRNTKFNRVSMARNQEGVLEKSIKTCFSAGFHKPALCVWIGMIFIIVMAGGIPRIQTVKHLTNPFIKSTPEAKDIAYIEQHLSTGTSFSLIVEPFNNGLSQRGFWYDLIKLEKDIASLPGVQSVESLTRLIFTLSLKLSAGGIKPEAVFQQLQKDQRNMLKSYFDPTSGKLRLIIHIRSHSSDQIEEILRNTKVQAEKILEKKAGIELSGQLIWLRSQTTDIVLSELKTLFGALLIITTLMMIQLKSVVLGLLSLIPNAFPLICIFGIMGWFNIPLDPLTIFAAVISFGLSVDDSIHYLTRLKEEIKMSKPGVAIHDWLKAAYHRTSRALISTTAVFLLSASGLLFSSFSHVFSLGILLFSASAVALIGDLIVLPATVLTFGPLNNLLLKIKRKSDDSLPK